MEANPVFNSPKDFFDSQYLLSAILTVNYFITGTNIKLVFMPLRSPFPVRLCAYLETLTACLLNVVFFLPYSMKI